ncbi:unnamed protein product [Microthlaspi erraticum]|uniref:HSF-type DNA-binding domain-containing protein n=1 Tax=Microthlaspi erraticum TaxID=1685480 RepID=A0A6D2KGE1_9BRAS|nr:unnamed protein product [Microthlaspi erraticum]
MRVYFSRLSSPEKERGERIEERNCSDLRVTSPIEDMARARARGSARRNLAPLEFLNKTYQMVDDPSTDSVISWGQNGNSIIVLDPEEFARNLIFRLCPPASYTNFQYFTLKLTGYGLNKVEQSEHEWEFANGDFVRGHPERLKNIIDIYRARLESLYELHCKPTIDRMRSHCRAGGSAVTFFKERREGRYRELREEREKEALANSLENQCNV